MTNKKSTKRALLLSALSLLLCVSMLIGSTFAWFTDSVTSGKNQIVAGNLDVELDYKKVVGGVATEWASVKDQTEIFDPNALWEPGHVEVVYLRVSNKGSLELKYQLGVNFKDITIGKTEDGKEIKLSDHLVFATVASDTETIYANRDEVVKAAAGTEKGLKDYNGKTTALEVNGVDYLTLIVYMPETVGNEANYRGNAIPTIELGINLYATQYTAEDDSFDEFYDKNAWVKGFKVYSANELQGAINAGEPAITLMDNIDATEAVVIPEGKTVALNLNGKTLEATADAAIRANGNLNLTGEGTIKGNAGQYVVRAQAGSTVTVDDGIVVEGGFGAVAVPGGTLIINGGNFSNVEVNSTHYVVSAWNNGKIIINGGNFTFAADQYASANGSPVIGTWDGGAVEINGGTFDASSGSALCYAGANVVVKGGTFMNAAAKTYGGGTVADKVATGFKVIENDGVYYVVPDGVSNVVTTAAQLQTALDAATGNATIVLAADINGDVTVNQKEGVNIVIDGKNYKYDGVITIDGKARHTGTETLNIKSVNFETAKDNVDFISSNIAKQYAHNVTIEDCTFTNKGEGTVVPARFRQAYNITMKNCTVEGTFSPLWATGVKGLTIDNVIANCKNEGINVGASDNVLIENCKITVAAANGFGIRTDATADYKMTVNNCELNAAETIVIRGSADTYTVIVDGMKLAAPATLQKMIENAADGDTIALSSGTYAEVTLKNVAENLTIVGTKGAVVKGMALDIQSFTPQSNRLYGFTLKNVAFESKGLYVTNSNKGTPWGYIENFTMDGCSFKGDNQDDVAGNRLFDLGTDSPGSHQFINLKITNCTVDTGVQGIRVGALRGNCEISGNVINNVDHNAITIRSVQEGTVLVKGNTLSNAGDRALRVGANSATINFVDNVIVNCGDEEGSNFKANTLGTVTFEGNTVDGAAWNP